MQAEGLLAVRHLVQDHHIGRLHMVEGLMVAVVGHTLLGAVAVVGLGDGMNPLLLVDYTDYTHTILVDTYKDLAHNRGYMDTFLSPHYSTSFYPYVFPYI